MEDVAVTGIGFPTTDLTTMQTCLTELNLTNAKIHFVCISELVTYSYAYFDHLCDTYLLPPYIAPEVLEGALDRPKNTISDRLSL